MGLNILAKINRNHWAKQFNTQPLGADQLPLGDFHLDNLDERKNGYNNHFGIRKNSGNKKPDKTQGGEPPPSLPHKGNIRKNCQSKQINEYPGGQTNTKRRKPTSWKNKGTIAHPGHSRANDRLNYNRSTTPNTNEGKAPKR